MLKTKRELGLFGTIMMGLSGAIGFEIFVLLDYAYFDLAGSNIVVALILAGFINMLTMFSYCELSAAMPKVGGEYTYIKTAYGGYISFISGCFRWLASVLCAALAAVSFTTQLAYLFSFIAPVARDLILDQMPFITVIVVVFFTALDVKGVKKIGSILVIAFLAIFTIFIVTGLAHGLTPLQILPEDLKQDLPRIFSASVYMFPMFFGMRALVAQASVVNRPEKNVPRGIIASTLLIIPLYISLAYVAAGVVPPNETSSSAPFLHLAAQEIMGSTGGVLMALAGIVASSSALSTSIAVQSSISRGMSRDKYLPQALLSLHPHFNTPYIALITGSIFIALFSAFGGLSFLGYAASFATLIVFAFVNLSLLKLRREKPHMEKPFKTPFYPLTPIAGFIFSIALLVFPIFVGDVYAIDALFSGIGLTTLALILYYLRMVGRSRVQIALGGAGLGIGVFLAILTIFAETGFVPTFFPFVPNNIILIVSLVSIVAGVLNTTMTD